MDPLTGVAALMTALSLNLHQEATRGGALALDPGTLATFEPVALSPSNLIKG